jgi:hypothetical protein
MGIFGGGMIGGGTMRCRGGIVGFFSGEGALGCLVGGVFRRLIEGTALFFLTGAGVLMGATFFLLEGFAFFGADGALGLFFMDGGAGLFFDIRGYRMPLA